MSKEKQLVKNIIIISVSKVFTSLFSFLLLPLYTNYLSTSEYGIVDLVITYGALIAPIAMLRMEIAVFRWLVDARKNSDDTKHIISSALQLLMICLLMFTAIYLVVNLCVTIPYWQYILFYVLSMALSSVMLQTSRGVGKTVDYAIGSIITGLFTITSSLILIMWLGWKADGVLLGMTLGFLAGVIFVVIRMKLHKLIVRGNDKRAMQKELLKFSLPMVPNSLSWWIVNASGRTIISSVIGVAANGIYAVATKFSVIAYSLYSIFDLSWSESAALYIDAPDRDKFFSNVMNKIVSVFGSICVMILAFVPLVFPLFVANDFAEALLYIPLLMFGIFGDIMVKAYGNIYIAKKMSKKVMTTTIASAIINIVINLALIWFIGIWAAAISTVTSYFIMVIYRHYDVQKYVKITYEKGIFVKIIALFALASAFYYYNTLLTNIIGVVVITSFAILLNHNILKSGWGIVKRKLKK
ncbi:hypothetical protein FACS189431_0340 [Alphaproteobacteria bacterium]|nr:hypothetical protein FACS189431_0340 [Alphaproteobacteria bacterium]